MRRKWGEGLMGVRRGKGKAVRKREYEYVVIDRFCVYIDRK
jgi:hypothetical protein